METCTRFFRPAFLGLICLLGFAPSARALLTIPSTPATGAIAVGNSHVVALRSDGTVWTWGENGYGQLGINSSTAQALPTQASGLTNIVAVAAGFGHTVALKSDGTVWTWGRNFEGQLGLGGGGNRLVPTQISNFGDVVAIAVGHNHTLALKSDGTVWTWGANYNGQLGLGDTVSTRTSPMQTSLTDVVEIAGAYLQGVARKSDGTIWMWGNNGSGQLGDGTTAQRLAPVRSGVSVNLDHVVAVAAGEKHTIVVKNVSGTVSVWIWGSNSGGQLGDGTLTQRITPVQISGLTDVVAVAGGSQHTVALKTDGSLLAWGTNAIGQLGDGTTIQRKTPVPVSDLTGVVAVAAGPYHTMVIKNDGTVRLWSYVFPTSTQVPQWKKPVQVTGLTNVTSLASSYDSAVAVKADGSVSSWGVNSSGQLGDGTTTNRMAPVPVSGLDHVVAVATGSLHSIALKDDGTVWLWGIPPGGIISTGSNPAVVSGLSDVVAVAAGGDHAVALKSVSGVTSVWTWGRNGNGQLGQGDNTTRPTPTKIDNFDNVVAVAAGGFPSTTGSGSSPNGSHTVALKSVNGVTSVWTWGNNFNGQLGNNSTTQGTVPVEVSGLTEVVAVAAGASHTVALKSSGGVTSVWTWGNNANGQLGNNSTVQSLVPVQASGLGNVVKVAAGASHTVALKGDGTVWVWGSNADGQLGITGFASQVLIPTQIPGLDHVAAIAAGRAHTMVVKEDGTVWAWGTNASGQVGTWLLPKILGVPIRLNGDAGGTDMDKDGMPDLWETDHFAGSYQAHTGALDADNDGLTDIQEYFHGSHPNQPDVDGDLLTDIADLYPTDYYNNQAPKLSIDSGNHQIGPSGHLNANPFVVKVKNATETLSLSNAPVTFTVTSGSGRLAEESNDTPQYAPLPTLTAPNGKAQAFYEHTTNFHATSLITVTAGTATPVVFQTWNFDPDDTDDDDLPDAWELLYFPTLQTTSGGDDPDGDGFTNLQEYQNSTDPTDYYNGATPVITVLEGGNGLPGAGGLLRVQIKNASGTSLVNAPVTFAIFAGSSQLATTSAGTPLAASITVRTGAGGNADAYYVTPIGQPAAGTVDVHAGLASTAIVLDEPPPPGGGSNESPVVMLRAPLDNGVIKSAFGVVLVARAYDADGTIAKVEFFGDNVKLGEATTYPYYYVWSNPSAGTHSITAKATDNSGAQTVSTAVSITYGPPAAAQASYDFETTEGFTVPNFPGSSIWTKSGTVQVTNSAAHSGTQSVIIPSPGNGSSARLPLPALAPGQTERYIDFWWKPVADAAVAGGSAISLNGQVVSFKRNGSTAELQRYFFDDGNDHVLSSGKTIAVDANGVAVDWQHITLRQVSNQIEVYLDGQPVLFASTTEPGYLVLTGHASQPTLFDRVSILSGNPFFADADHDGMDDAWEAAHELDPTVDDREGDADHDGAINAQEQQQGTSPVNPGDSDGDNLQDPWELKHFGNLDPFGFQNPDNDNQTNEEEETAGTDPLDPYNGHSPVVLTIVGGNNQEGPAGRENEYPLSVSVFDGTTPLVGAPVVFTVTQGTGGSVYTYAGGGQTVTAYSDEQGIARVFFGQPVETGVTSVIRAATVAGTISEVFFSTISGIGTQPYTEQPVSFSTVSGHNPSGLFGQFNVRPLVLTLGTQQSGLPVGNAPIVFTVTGGGGKLAATRSGAGAATLTVNTDAYGRASIYYRHPPADGGWGRVRASIGEATYEFVTRGRHQTIATGGSHVLALLPDRTVEAWGGNTQGQLGEGTTTSSLVPVAVPDLDEVIAVAAHGDQSMALQQDGAVWVWGAKVAASPTTSPVEVANLSDVAAIAAGGNFRLALKTDGTLWSLNYDATGGTLLPPAQVEGLTGVMSIAAGGGHGLALLEDGTSWAWGQNGSGQLGNGYTDDSAVPVRINSISNVVMVAAGDAHSLGLDIDGTVWAWGANADGQVGNGTTTNQLGPVQVAGLTDIIAVAASASTSFALRSDGTIWAWGDNSQGQLGDGTTIDQSVPKQVGGLYGVIALAGGDGHALALKSNGTLWGWGDNAYWQVSPVSSLPTQVNINLAPPSGEPPENGEPPPDDDTGPSPDPTGAVRLQIYLPPRLSSN